MLYNYIYTHIGPYQASCPQVRTNAFRSQHPLRGVGIQPSNYTLWLGGKDHDVLQAERPEWSIHENCGLQFGFGAQLSSKLKY